MRSSSLNGEDESVVDMNYRYDDICHLPCPNCSFAIITVVSTRDDEVSDATFVVALVVSHPGRELAHFHGDRFVFVVRPQKKNRTRYEDHGALLLTNVTTYPNNADAKCGGTNWRLVRGRPDLHLQLVS